MCQQETSVTAALRLTAPRILCRLSDQRVCCSYLVERQHHHKEVLICPSRSRRLSIFEPVSKQWQTQLVTGNPPECTESQCVVGVQGDNGTYEIFMYGGQVPYDMERTVDLGAVWVLSLPAFHWERQPDPLRFGRFMHSCQVIGRQMISTGGIVVTSNIPEDDWYSDYFGGALDPS